MGMHLLPLVRACRLFTDADENTLRAAAEAGRVSTHGAGDVLFRAGERARDFLVVRRGLVKIVRQGASGTPTTLGIFGPREPIGLPAVLGGAEYPADAIAACDHVELLHIPADVVRAAMDHDTGLVRAMNRVLLEHTTLLHHKIDVLTAGEVPARLATLLAHLADRFGDEQTDGSTFLPIALSRTDLSRLVGARVETVTRVMTRWQKDGLVETTKDGFRLFDRTKLDAER